MKLGVVREAAPGETRVALIPETVSRLKKDGWTVLVQKGAGASAYFPDAAYSQAGAELLETATDVARAADVLVSVTPPAADVIKSLRPNTTLVALLDALRSPDLLSELAKAQISAIAMELVPRITRAQSMDVLSSQASVAGY